MKPKRFLESFKDRNALLEFCVCILLFGIFLCWQCTRLTSPPWESFESWRQTDTYSIALNFYQYDMNPLKAQLNYDGITPNYVQLELQIIPYLSALLFQLFHTTSWVIPRVIGLLFFTGSAVYLYLLLKRFVGAFPSLVGLAVYLFTPLSVMMATSIQPESCALFFYCASAYYLRRFQENSITGFAIAASAMAAVAIMEKPPAAFLGFVFLFVFVEKYGKKVFRTPLVYLCGVIAVAPFLLLMAYTSQISTLQLVDGIATKHIFTSQIFSFFTKDGIKFMYSAAGNYFGWPVMLLTLVGFLLSFVKERRFALIWALAFALECITIVAAIKFNYYLVFILPVCALLSSFAAEELLKCRRSVAAVVCAAALCFTLRLDVQRWRSTQVQTTVDQVGAFLSEVTEPEDGIAIAVMDPSCLNAANRRGYRANIHYYSEIPDGPEEEIAYYTEKGVRWFVVVNGSVVSDSDGTYLAYLQEHYPLYAENEVCQVYDIGK